MLEYEDPEPSSWIGETPVYHCDNCGAWFIHEPGYRGHYRSCTEEDSA